MNHYIVLNLWIKVLLVRPSNVAGRFLNEEQQGGVLSLARMTNLRQRLKNFNYKFEKN
jgi:hypothetical protein